MPTELGRALVASDLISPEALADALYHSATRQVALARALVDVGALGLERLQQELDRASGDEPLTDLAVASDLVALLPAGTLVRLYAVPIVGIEEGAYRVAVADMWDLSALEELAECLDGPVVPVRATIAAIEAALGRSSADTANLPIPLTPRRRPDPDKTPPYGYRALFPEQGLHDHDADPMPLSRPSKSKSKSPVALAAVPLSDVGAIFAALRVAGQKERVLDLLVAGARTVARRVAVFAARRDQLDGYRCSSLFGDEKRFRRVRLPWDDGNVLADVARGAMHLGRVLDVPANGPLVTGLEIGQREVAIVAVRVDGIASLVLLADELTDASAAAARLEDLALAAGEAFARIVRAGR